MTLLHFFGDWLRNLLMLFPRPAVRALFVALPVVVLFWMWLLPRTRAVEHLSDGWTRDLKVWATLALVIQIVIYSLV
jgi:hypothetical protein